MRILKPSELTAVSGGTNPHLIDVNPGGQSNPSTRKNPNTTTVRRPESGTHTPLMGTVVAIVPAPSRLRAFA